MVSRRLNVKFLLVVVGCLVGAAGATHLVHAFQLGRHARTLHEQARQAEEQGRLDRAVNLWQRYFLFAPDDNESLVHYRDLLDRTALTPIERRQVSTVFRQAMAREPGREDLRRRLAVALIREGDGMAARPHLELLLEHHPDDGDLEAMLGLCLEWAGEGDQAAALYERALEHSPQRVDVYVRLAQLLRGPLGRPHKGARVLDRLVQARPKQADSYLERAAYRADLGSMEDAAADMARALELAGDEPRTLQAAVDLALRRGRLDEARRFLDKLQARQPNDPNACLALAALDLRQGHSDKAVDRLRAALDKSADHSDLLMALTEAHITRGEDSDAREVIAHLRSPGAPRGLADFLEGRLRTSHRDWAPALEKFRAVMDMGEHAPALAARAAVEAALCYEHLGDLDHRVEAAQEAVRLDATSGPARLELAAALEAAGKGEEALAQYRKAVALPRPPEGSAVLLARALVRRNRSQTTGRRSWDEVERLLDRAARVPSQEAAAAVVRAEALAAQEQPLWAREVLYAALKTHPKEPSLWVALADLEARQGDRAAAVRALDEARDRLGDRPELARAEAALCLQRCPQAAARLRRLEQGLASLGALERQRLACQLANSWLQLDEPTEAARVCRLVAQDKETDLGTGAQLLDAALAAGDDELAAGLVARLREQEGEGGTWWRYGEAARRVLKAQRGDRAALEEARGLMVDLGKCRPGWSRAALLAAYLEELTGDPGKAIDAYLRAFELGERQPGVVQRLVRLLAGQGRDTDADEVVRRVQQQTEVTGPLARLAADVAVRLRNPERAVEMALRAVPADSKDFREQVWLGQVLALAGRRAAAEEALWRAVHLAPALPEPWLALVAHLDRTGQDTEATRAIAQMRRKVPADQAPLALAACYEAMARFGLADAAYTEALQRSAEDGLVLLRAASFFVRLDQPARSVPLLRKLLDVQVQVPEPSRLWARRQLALALAFDGDAEKYRQAQELVRQATSEDVQGQRARDLVTAARPEGRAEALARIEASRKGAPLTADELYRLAQAYEAAGSLNRAREVMLEVLTLDGQGPGYLAHHIASLLRQGKWDEARPWVLRLEKLEPGSDRVRKFRVALAGHHG